MSSVASRDRTFLTNLVGPGPETCTEPCPTCKGTDFNIKICLGHEQINNAGRYMAICKNPDCIRFYFENRKPAHWLTDGLEPGQMKKYATHRAQGSSPTKPSISAGPSPAKSNNGGNDKIGPSQQQRLEKLKDAISEGDMLISNTRTAIKRPVGESDEEDSVMRHFTTPKGTIGFVKVDGSIGSTMSFIVPSSQATSSWAPTTSPSAMSSIAHVLPGKKMEVIVYFYYDENDTPLREVAHINPCMPNAGWVHWDRDFQFTLEASGIRPRTTFHLWRPQTQKWSTMFRDGMTLVAANEFLIVKTRGCENNLLGLDILKSALAHALAIPFPGTVFTPVVTPTFGVNNFEAAPNIRPYEPSPSSTGATVASSSKVTLDAPMSKPQGMKRKMDTSDKKAVNRKAKGKQRATTEDEDDDAVEELTSPSKKMRAATPVIVISD